LIFERKKFWKIDEIEGRRMRERNKKEERVTFSKLEREKDNNNENILSREITSGALNPTLILNP
jgi:hypothetical protein